MMPLRLQWMSASRWLAEYDNTIQPIESLKSARAVILANKDKKEAMYWDLCRIRDAKWASRSYERAMTVSGNYKKYMGNVNKKRPAVNELVTARNVLADKQPALRLVSDSRRVPEKSRVLPVKNATNQARDRETLQESESSTAPDANKSMSVNSNFLPAYFLHRIWGWVLRLADDKVRCCNRNSLETV